MDSSFVQIQTGWASHFRTTSNKDSFKFQFQCQVWLPFWCTWSQCWKLYEVQAQSPRAHLIQRQSSSLQLARVCRVIPFQLLWKGWTLLSFLWDLLQGICLWSRNLHVSHQCLFLNQVWRGKCLGRLCAQISTYNRTALRRDNKGRRSLKGNLMFFPCHTLSYYLICLSFNWSNWGFPHLRPTSCLLDMM